MCACFVEIEICAHNQNCRRWEESPATGCHRGQQNQCMNKQTSPASAMAARMLLKSQLIGHMADLARITPAAPASGIKAVQASARTLSVVKELDAGKR